MKEVVRKRVSQKHLILNFECQHQQKTKRLYCPCGMYNNCKKRESQKYMILRLPLFFLITAIGIYQLCHLVYHYFTKKIPRYANTLPIKNSFCLPVPVPLEYCGWFEPAVRCFELLFACI
jgi:hypothetical protein